MSEGKGPKENELERRRLQAAEESTAPEIIWFCLRRAVREGSGSLLFREQLAFQRASPPFQRAACFSESLPLFQKSSRPFSESAFPGLEKANHCLSSLYLASGPATAEQLPYAVVALSFLLLSFIYFVFTSLKDK